MSLWALCTMATINTWKAFDSHISKTCHKAHASLFPQPGPHGRGEGGCHKGTIQPWQGRLDQASRVRHNRVSAQKRRQLQHPIPAATAGGTLGASEPRRTTEIRESNHLILYGGKLTPQVRILACKRNFCLPCVRQCAKH